MHIKTSNFLSLLVVFAVVLFLGFVPAQAQSNSQNLILSGQNCDDFIWFRKGSSMEFEVKNGKGKLIQSTKMHVKDVKNIKGGTLAIIQVSDGKDMDLEIEYKCIGQNMYMDFSAMMKQAMQKTGANFEQTAAAEKVLNDITIESTSGFTSFPKNMSVGQKLDPVSFSIQTGAESVVKMNITTNQDNRLVEAKEKITTPAGSFDCVRISSEINSSMKVMGMNQKMPSIKEKLWFAPKIGLIKQENYNAKGNLESTMQLVKFSY